MRNMSVDPDLDEVLSRRGRDALVNGADPLGNGYIEADNGESRVLDIQRFALTTHCPAFVRNPP